MRLESGNQRAKATSLPSGRLVTRVLIERARSNVHKLLPGLLAEGSESVSDKCAPSGESDQLSAAGNASPTLAPRAPVRPNHARSTDSVAAGGRYASVVSDTTNA